MVGIVITAGILVGLSGTSLWSTRRAHQKLKSGDGGYEELLDVTGVFERRELLKMPGVSIGPGRKLQFDPAHFEELRPHGVAQWLGTPVGDALTIAASLAAVGLEALGRSDWSGPLITTAAVYIAASWIAGFYLFFRHADASELE